MRRLAIITALLFTLFYPIKKAQAAFVPIYTETNFVMSMYPVMGGLALMFNKKECRVLLCLDKLAGLALFTGGILILDEDTSSLSFSKLSVNTAKRIGITESQRESFNNSIEEINLIKDEIILEVMEAEEGNKLEVANRQWEQASQFLDHDTAIAVRKMRNFIKDSVENK